MAQEQQAQGAPVDDIPPQTEIEPQAAQDDQPPQDDTPPPDDAPDPYAPLAQKMGWVPREQFKGNPDDWKPAEQFILDGKEIQKNLAGELKSVRQQLDVIGRTSASIVQQQVEDKRRELAEKFQRAVDDGDTNAAWKVSEQLNSLGQQAPDAGVGQPASGAAPPEVMGWAEKNSSWFKKDPVATLRAVEVTNRLAAMGYDTDTQLRSAEETVKREFPHLFNGAQQQAPKPPPQVAQPGARSAGQQRGRETFADMPQAAQKVARDMVERGVIPNVEAYAKNYFANVKG